MSIEDVKLMAAYMTVHSDDEDERMAIGHSLMNKVIGSMNGMGDMPGLSEDKKEDFFNLINGKADKENEDAFKRNLIIAGAIQLGNMKDPTDGAIDFMVGKKDGIKVTHKSKNYNFYKPDESQVIDSKTKSSKGRKTKGS